MCTLNMHPSTPTSKIAWLKIYFLILHQPVSQSLAYALMLHRAYVNYKVALVIDGIQRIYSYTFTLSQVLHSWTACVPAYLEPQAW